MLSGARRVALALALTTGVCAEAGAQDINPVGYTLTLNPNHSGAAIGIYDNVTSMTLPSEVWAGHTFYGWAETASGAVAYHAGDQITLTSNKTLYGQWDEINTSFTISPISLSSADFDESGYAPLTVTAMKPSQIICSSPFDTSNLPTIPGQPDDEKHLA